MYTNRDPFPKRFSGTAYLETLRDAQEPSPWKPGWLVRQPLRFFTELSLDSGWTVYG